MEFEQGKNLRVGIRKREKCTCWSSNKGKIYVLEFEQGKNLRVGIDPAAGFRHICSDSRACNLLLRDKIMVFMNIFPNLRYFKFSIEIRRSGKICLPNRTGPDQSKNAGSPDRISDPVGSYSVLSTYTQSNGSKYKNRIQFFCNLLKM